MEADAGTDLPGVFEELKAIGGLQKAEMMSNSQETTVAVMEDGTSTTPAMHLNRAVTDSGESLEHRRDNEEGDVRENLPQNNETASEKEARLKAEREKRKIASLHAQINAAKKQMEDIERDIAEGKMKLKNPDAQSTITRHITLLHDYNAIRDVGQGLMGLIADRKGIRIRDVYRDMGVAEGD